jgi:hypothetical protein
LDVASSSPDKQRHSIKQQQQCLEKNHPQGMKDNVKKEKEIATLLRKFPSQSRLAFAFASLFPPRPHLSLPFSNCT